jgi:hypothetical protein
VYLYKLLLFQRVDSFEKDVLPASCNLAEITRFFRVALFVLGN